MRVKIHGIEVTTDESIKIMAAGRDFEQMDNDPEAWKRVKKFILENTDTAVKMIRMTPAALGRQLTAPEFEKHSRALDKMNLPRYTDSVIRRELEQCYTATEG